MIYLDNAATTSPKPEIVIKEVNTALRRYTANPGRGGHAPSIAAAEAVYKVRSAAKDFFHTASEENVIFTSGCTESLNTVIKGVLKPGDHVIVSSLEHNAVVRPLYQMKEQRIIDYSVADVSLGDEEATINAFRNAINERTRMIVCTQASNVFGIRLPTERLCALAHSYGILFCMDAAQSAGVLDIDMERDRYDYVCCAGHKGLYGPAGIGLLLTGNAPILEPLKAGGTGSESAKPDMPEYYPDRLESGTLNIPGICGLGGGLRYLKLRGRDAVMHHEMHLMKRLYRGLSKIDGVVLYTPEPEESLSAPVLSFNVRDKDSEATASYLNKSFGIAVRAGLHCAPVAHRWMGTIDSGTVRVAPSAFTAEKEIEILLHAIKNFARNP